LNFLGIGFARLTQARSRRAENWNTYARYV